MNHAEPSVRSGEVADEAVTTVVVVLGTLLVLVTALPIVPGNDSWIRMWDFPRMQVAPCSASSSWPFP
jgi:hypothetical protein